MVLTIAPTGALAVGSPPAAGAAIAILLGAHPLRARGELVVDYPGRAFELGASQPNPLHGAGAATLRYGVPRETHVTLELFDVNGRRVRTIVDGLQSPGWYDVTIESGGLRGGVFFYRMRAGSFSATRRMVIVR